MTKSKKKKQPRPTPPPKGMVDAADDLYLDIINSPPDPDEVVYRVNLDGSITTFPATELDPKDW